MKKYISTVSFAKITVLVFMLFSTLINAQEDLPDAPLDEPATPLDGYVWVLAFIGLFYVYIRLSAFTKQAKSESK